MEWDQIYEFLECLFFSETEAMLHLNGELLLCTRSLVTSRIYLYKQSKKGTLSNLHFNLPDLFSLNYFPSCSFQKEAANFDKIFVKFPFCTTEINLIMGLKMVYVLNTSLCRTKAFLSQNRRKGTNCSLFLRRYRDIESEETSQVIEFSLLLLETTMSSNSFSVCPELSYLANNGN